MRYTSLISIGTLLLVSAQVGRSQAALTSIEVIQQLTASIGVLGDGIGKIADGIAHAVEAKDHVVTMSRAKATTTEHDHTRAAVRIASIDRLECHFPVGHDV